MKRSFLYIVVALLLLSSACTEKWDQHYMPENKEVASDLIEVASMSAEEYIQSNTDLTSIASLFTEQNVFTELESKDQLFTVLVYSNSVMSGAQIDDPAFFANTCVSDLAFTPTKLVDGLSIRMWNGKYLAVAVDKTTNTTDYYIAESKISKIIQVDNGYVYLMSSPIYAPKSMYEVLNALGDDYSMFKDLVFSYEEQTFDRSNSVPVGIDNTGNTVYDSVFVTKNLLMDRYSSGGSESWNMRSEFYSSTMLIPNNTLVEGALTKAYQDVRDALGREPNANDTLKFEQYIIKSAFYDYVISADSLNGVTDIYSVSGYIEGESSSTSGVQWKPTVQRVDTSNPVQLSNGVAYYTTALKIPNNVVIYRIKNRFYIWEYCDETQKAEYFKTVGMQNFDVKDEGGFGPLGPWPFIPYKTLRAYPTADAIANKSVVSVEFTGISLNEDGTIAVVMVPPGEYNLRMGFRNQSFPYRDQVYVNDVLVNDNVNPNTHYDRTALGYPEGYVWKDYYAISNRANYYDCDGSEVGIVTIEGTELQPIRIKVESNSLTTYAFDGSSKAYYQTYCWTLRPTANNY
ncbi:hypothetical protein [Mangrovibacterium diazotrophicum]|uniref:Fasciclin domain-containing protein n=1 Tax=Mangrovibacterium diazotrophicum TaxID=1261403 RepID=A0A419W674_9BACT|nr:hypothetical protein [Mangrovibacterium diazotrophicum]RKD90957.1 hypothetical protein BC643_1304 [Mangrovibacterium diazotrophicum]